VRPIRITRPDGHAGRFIFQVSQTDNPQTSRPTAYLLLGGATSRMRIPVPHDGRIANS
jgi:hypothetical protein